MREPKVRLSEAGVAWLAANPGHDGLRVVRVAKTEDGREVEVWGLEGPRSGPDDMVTGLYELLWTKAPRVARDERPVPHALKLRILARKREGMTVHDIARDLICRRDVVRRVLSETDAREAA